ncbi:uncharacterized protein TM35_000331130 [Trypanosoma theileri]|uniref:Uncharacterized protein n=1 Tax=Trypanosoma theileri TaxID=67003 RepID=A0A1X0NLR5_9TRYP|nr:uncharacterized protein TM35_000331130 [Trypanosoma theileri]ORC85656.1 hypothetical protein TM35_000331130 [Trypanosoma theileri]
MMYYNDGGSDDVNTFSDSSSELESVTPNRINSLFTMASAISTKIQNAGQVLRSLIHHESGRASESLPLASSLQEDGSSGVCGVDPKTAFDVDSHHEFVSMDTSLSNDLTIKDESSILKECSITVQTVQPDKGYLLVSDKGWENGVPLTPPHTSHHSFSSYLTKSSLRRLEEELCERIGNNNDKNSESQDGSSFAACATDSSFSCAQFSTELNAYAKKIIVYIENILMSLSDDNNMIFTSIEKKEIEDITDSIKRIVKDICTASDDVQKGLDSYNAALKMMTEKTKLYEKRIVHMTQEKEAVADSRREAVLEVSKQLQKKRTEVKSLLLQSGVRNDELQNTSLYLESGKKLKRDVQFEEEEAICGLSSDSRISPTSEVLQKSDRMDACSINSSLTMTCDNDVESRRRWILDNALGYFLRCKEPSVPECVCTMIARMQPHEMANDVLRSRRQMSCLFTLMNRCPAATSFYLMLLDKRMEAIENVLDNLEKECFTRKKELFDHYFNY